MKMIESDVNQERLLARTLIDLREAYTRARMLLPALSMDQMLMLSGAMEQAKTEGMKGVRSRTEGKALPASKRARKDEAGDDPSEAEFPVLPNTLSVSAGKRRMHLVVAAATIMAKEGPLTVRGLIDAIEERGWKLSSKSPNAAQIIRHFLKRNKKHFKPYKIQGKPHFGLRREGKIEAPKRAAKKTPWRQQKDERAESRALIVKTLTKVDGPITIRDIAEKMGRDTGKGIVPVMVALQEAGAVKKIVKGDDTLWDPNPDKLREYGKSLNGTFTKAHVDMLNGVSAH